MEQNDKYSNIQFLSQTNPQQYKSTAIYTSILAQLNKHRNLKRFIESLS